MMKYKKDKNSELEEAYRAYKKEWQKKYNADPVRKLKEINRYLKKQYNITLEQYNEIYNKQKGKCAICNKKHMDGNKRLSVDHNHTTRMIRGLLCQNCNVGLGNFQDSIKFLKKAAKYLKNYEIYPSDYQICEPYFEKILRDSINITE